MARVTVTKKDIDRLKSLMDLFGAARKSAFLELLKLYFDCSDDAAAKIAQTFFIRKTFFQSKNKYGYWRLVKSQKDTVPDFTNIDIFEAYVELYRKLLDKWNSTDEQERSSNRPYFLVGKLEFPYDYTFVAEGDALYKVVSFDENGYQKLEFVDRMTGKNREGTVILVVVTSKSDPDPSALEMTVPHRIAVVRTQKEKVACRISDIQED